MEKGNWMLVMSLDLNGIDAEKKKEIGFILYCSKDEVRT